MGLYLNVGSGQRPFDRPWINVDIQAKWNPDVVADASHSGWTPDESADIICLHHVLEHFGCGEAVPLLRECRRILSSNGSLLVFVPDMRELVDMWKEGRLSDQVFMTNVYGAYMGDVADTHKWGYTHASLKQLLLDCGFKHVHGWAYRDITGAKIAQARWILSMEAIK